MCVCYSFRNAEYFIPDLFFDSSKVTTVAKLPFDKNNFELFYVIHQWILELAHSNFAFMSQGQIHCLITLDDAEG